ncbi:MAG: hypothetical protein GY757_03280 [bacterium]|nr:hypothetical protein [bacterium]
MKKDNNIQHVSLFHSQTVAAGQPNVDFSVRYWPISDLSPLILNSELRRSPKKKKTISTERTAVEIEIVRKTARSPDGRRDLAAFKVLAKLQKHLYSLIFPLFALLRPEEKLPVIPGHQEFLDSLVKQDTKRIKPVDAQLNVAGFRFREVCDVIQKPGQRKSRNRFSFKYLDNKRD